MSSKLSLVTLHESRTRPTRDTAVRPAGSRRISRRRLPSQRASSTGPPPSQTRASPNASGAAGPGSSRLDTLYGTPGIRTNRATPNPVTATNTPSASNDLRDERWSDTGEGLVMVEPALYGRARFAAGRTTRSCSRDRALQRLSGRSSARYEQVATRTVKPRLRAANRAFAAGES